MRKTGKLMVLITINDVSCNQIIIQSFHHHEDASLALWALFHTILFSLHVILILLHSSNFKFFHRIFTLYYVHLILFSLIFASFALFSLRLILPHLILIFASFDLFNIRTLRPFTFSFLTLLLAVSAFQGHSGGSETSLLKRTRFQAARSAE